MTLLAELVAGARVVGDHRPWRRVVVGVEAWRTVTDRLVAGSVSLLSLWGEPGCVHMAVSDAESADPIVLSLECPDGRYPSVGARHAPAIRLERALFDLYGLEPNGALDRRPWLDHGRWGVRQPLGKDHPADTGEAYCFLPAEGESLHQIAVGPVHAGIIEPGHFRFTANGETVVRLEARLGYLHRGLEARMVGQAPDQAAKFAARACGDSTVAYSIAFARGVEAALEAPAPARAHWLRALMAELERLANHLGDIGAICNDASFSLMHAHCGVLREQVLRACAAVFGHRLMMDAAAPGGVALDPGATELRLLRDLVAAVRGRLPVLISLYDDTASLQDRTVGSGVLTPALARQFAAGGYVGRASGRAFDARRAFAYAPYDALAFETPVREVGDVNARVWIRIDEATQSLALIEQILDRLPEGPVRRELPARSGEGMALIEGFRGDVLAWLRLEDGCIARCHLRDPSWFQWPLLEACIEGNIVADFPLCNKSFNCAYAGVDL
jgi:Ni,Fe-hydrogenase III large subunit